ncbi:hypothetical protein AFV6_gp20 [Betalipothrixvirus pozzuoliense]|uniref:Uncharacterized protein n=1 Tax=Betalipothrixvirus pozzuoliense TaxID=346882 RepID=A7WKH4_9VIRU|nr:hypothetical protein AFV6_gp20 [Acidianus filamentous virus 6]CAJ31574.1 conserved hypothetical protein [Acidianus filamentous virus 6]
MRYVTSISKNNFETNIFLSGWQGKFLEKEVAISIPRRPKEYGNEITVRVMDYLWIDDKLAERKTIEFDFHVTDFTVEFWNYNLRLLETIQNKMFLEMIFKECKCQEEHCYTNWKLEEIFIKELLKYLWREKLSVKIQMYKEECRDREIELACYKLYDLKHFR